MNPSDLLIDIRQLIDSARQRVALAVNAELTLLYWQVGQRIQAEVLQGERAAYGLAVVDACQPLDKALTYSEDALKRDFYIEMCRLERWSSRQLQERMNSMLFERSAIAKQPAETIRQELALLRQGQGVSQCC